MNEETLLKLERQTTIKSRKLHGLPGVYLDFLRIASALTVILIHAYSFLYNSLDPLGLGYDVAHTAVIVFFALSGFVITHTTTTNNRGAIQYIVARLSRLCSIIIPTLVITGLLQRIMMWADPAYTESFIRGSSLPRYVISAFFLNEVWWYSAAPPVNAPLWSLSYEFWYYLVFGLWLFRRGKWGLVWPLLGCALAGLKILALMPVELMGCIACQLPRPKLTNQVAWILIACCLILAVKSLEIIPYPYPFSQVPFMFSSQFVTDWVFGFFIGLTLWLLPMGKQVSKEFAWMKTLRLSADLTFPLYTLHGPLCTH